MPSNIQSTVDRLDKPSAYYLGRVGELQIALPRLLEVSTAADTSSYCRVRSVSTDVTAEMMMMLVARGHLRNQRIH